MQPRAFFESVREAHALAVEKVGSTELCLELAGRQIRITFASRILADRLSPALAHRRSKPEPGSETFDILVWDTTSSGVPAPRPPWGPYDYRQRGLIRGFNRDGMHTAYDVGPHVLSLLDESSGTAVFWTPDGQALPDYQVGSPFLVILHWWAEAQGMTLIHSGAVGTADGGVLLAGAGGSGKSTTALACIHASDLHYASDDYCLLDTSVGVRAHSVYNTGKLDRYSLTLLPHFKSFVSNQRIGDGEKGIIFLEDCIPEVLVASLPIKAIVLPSPSANETTSYRPASPAAALRALAPSTIFQLTGAGAAAFAELGSLVRRIPCFHLELGRDMNDVTRTVKSILERLA